MEVEEERLVRPHLAPGLVDQEQPLGGTVEDGAEVGIHRLDSRCA